MRRLARTIVQIIQETFPEHENLVGAEIGCWEGNSSASMLESLPTLRLYMIDPWLVGDNQVYCDTQDEMETGMLKAIQDTRFAQDRRFVLRYTSVDALAIIPDSYLDFVFVDADHRYEYVKEDMAWWEKIKPCGLFFGHDYNGIIERRTKGRRWGVKKAVDEFALENELEVRTHASLIWSILK